MTCNQAALHTSVRIRTTAQKLLIMQLISFKTAKLAKEKGYNPETLRCSFPYQEELQEWLRNEHNLHIVIIPTITCFWTYKIITLAGDIEQPPYRGVDASDYNTYEDALEAGLQEMLSAI